MKLIPTIILTGYTVFAVTTFLYAAQYWYAGLWFIGCVVTWFVLKKKLI